jgi:DNA-binding protein HU-beta
MTKTHTEDLLDATIAVLQKELLNGTSVQLQNLGTLEMKRRNARVVVHPKTQERTEVPEKMQLSFKPNQSTKEMFKQIKKEG